MTRFFFPAGDARCRRMQAQARPMQRARGHATAAAEVPADQQVAALVVAAPELPAVEEGGSSAIVERAGARDEQRAPACGAGSQTQVPILVIEEEALVEAMHRLEAGASREQARARETGHRQGSAHGRNLEMVEPAARPQVA